MKRTTPSPKKKEKKPSLTDEQVEKFMKRAHELALKALENPTKHDTFYEQHPKLCS